MADENTGGPGCLTYALWVLSTAIPSKSKRKILLSRVKNESNYWVLRKLPRKFTGIINETCLDVSGHWRNFDILEQKGLG